MYIGNLITDNATFFGDPVSLDKEESTITFWHCGMAACNLARNDEAIVGVHPNRKIGPVMDFGCKPNKDATIFRVGRKPNGEFRLLIIEGEILDEPKQFNGTSIVVKTDSDAFDIVKDTIKNGWEPHYVVAYKRIGSILEKLANILNIEVIKY